MLDSREQRIKRDSKIALAIAFGLFLFGLGVGYMAGKDAGTAQIRFELLPCND